MRKKNWRKWILLLIVIAAALLLWSRCGHKPESAGGPMGGAGAMPAMPVTIAQPVQKRISEWDEYTGRFSSPDSVEVRARVEGFLESVHFHEGGIVKKGDLLFIIDPRPYEASLQQAEASVKAATTRLELARKQFKRAQELVKTQVLSQSSYDERRQLQEEAAALLQAAEAERARARLNMEFTHVTAPVTGRISRKLVSEGNLITGGSAQSTLLTTIVSLDPLYFYFDIDEQNYLKYQRMAASGEQQSARERKIPISLTLMDEKNFTHSGLVDFIDNEIDMGSGALRARGVFENKDLLLSPGMFGRARIQASPDHEAVLINDNAVITDQVRKFVYVVDDAGLVSVRNIVPGGMSEGLRIVREGLKGDEWIIVKGVQRAKEGAKVMPEKGEMIEPPANAAAPAGTTGAPAPAAGTPPAGQGKK